MRPRCEHESIIPALRKAVLEPPELIRPSSRRPVFGMLSWDVDVRAQSSERSLKRGRTNCLAHQLLLLGLVFHNLRVALLPIELGEDIGLSRVSHRPTGIPDVFLLVCPEEVTGCALLEDIQLSLGKNSALAILFTSLVRSQAILMQRSTPLAYHEIPPSLLRDLEQVALQVLSNVCGMLVTGLHLIFLREAPINMGVDRDEVRAVPNDPAVPVQIPCIRNIDGEVWGNAPETGHGLFIPSLEPVTVGGFVEKLETHTVGDLGEVPNEELECNRRRLKVCRRVPEVNSPKGSPAMGYNVPG